MGQRPKQSEQYFVHMVDIVEFWTMIDVERIVRHLDLWGRINMRSYKDAHFFLTIAISAD